MSNNLKNCLGVLEYTANILNKSTQKAMFVCLSKDKQIYFALKEIAQNIINGNISVDEEIASELKKSANFIHKIAETNDDKQKVVKQAINWIWIMPLVKASFDLQNNEKSIEAIEKNKNN